MLFAIQRNHVLLTLLLLQAAKRAGWLSAEDNKYPRADHVPFGLVKGEDGKPMRTRSTEVVRLINLLDKAKSNCMEALVLRGMIFVKHTCPFMYFFLRQYIMFSLHCEEVFLTW